MPILSPNPNVGTGGAPVATPPMQGQYPGGNWLLQQYWNAARNAPWLLPQQGILNQTPYQEPQGPGGMPVMPERGLLERVAEIFQFGPKKGLLGVPGTEGAGGRGRGVLGGGGTGKYGSPWRSQAEVDKYAAEQGIPKGLLKPVERPPAPVVEHPATKSNRLWDEGQKMSDVRQEAMTVKSLTDLKPGEKIQMHPGTDTWMRGDRYGEVVGYNKAKGQFRVKLDASGKTIRVSPDNLMKRLPPDWMPPPREGASRTPWENMTPELWNKMIPQQQRIWQRDANWDNWPPTIRQAFKQRMGIEPVLRGPTSAQMARPVQQTPDMSAKLAEGDPVKQLSKAVNANFDAWAAKHAGAGWKDQLTPAQVSALKQAYWAYITGGR